MESAPPDEATRAYFDRIAASPSSTVWAGNIDKWEAVEPLLGAVPTHAEILECGAGTGMYTLRMLQCGYRVTAVDVSSHALEVTRRLAADRGLEKGLAIVHGAFDEVARGMRARFDAVVYFKTLHHFPHVGAIGDAIAAGYEALKPDGALIGLEPNGQCPFWRPGLLARGMHPEARMPVWRMERGLLLITEANLEQIFRRLSDARWEFHWLYPIPAALAHRLPSVCAPLNRLFSTTWLRRRSFNLAFQVWKASKWSGRGCSVGQQRVPGRHRDVSSP